MSDVTVVVVPRERFSLTERSLESIYEQTRHPFRLVYVDGGSPPRCRDYLERASRDRGFELVRTEHFLAPNESRNLGLAEVDTTYVVFIDNDVLVTPGWLERLVACADETGAWVVGPLYLEGAPGTQLVHMFGGEARVEGKTLVSTARFGHRLLPEVASELRREPVGQVEFHCLLARCDMFDRVGPLDEELLSTREHVDFCMAVRDAGGTVWGEPASVVTYEPPPPFDRDDRDFFLLRWSDAWNRASLARLEAKWKLTGDATWRRRQSRWLKKHRGLFFDDRVPRVVRPIVDSALALTVTRRELRRRQAAGKAI